MVIPAYNEEKHIGKCLDSAINNSGNRFHEIIVVDNASTDRTSEIAMSFSGVKIIREKTKGVMGARQRGVLESSGDIVAFVDADNIIPLGWFDTAQKEFRDNPSLVCLSGPYDYYDMSKLQRALAFFYWHVIVKLISLMLGYVGNFGNMLLRRETLEKMKGLDTSIAFYGDDTDTARRASKFGKVKFQSNFVLLSSGRRFFNQGWISTITAYILNFFSEVFFHRPLQKNYKNFR